MLQAGGGDSKLKKKKLKKIIAVFSSLSCSLGGLTFTFYVILDRFFIATHQYILYIVIYNI